MEDQNRHETRLVEYIDLLFGPVTSVLGPLCQDGQDESLYAVQALIEIIQKHMTQVAELIEEKVGQIEVQLEARFRPLASEILGIRTKGPIAHAEE